MTKERRETYEQSRPSSDKSVNIRILTPTLLRETAVTHARFFKYRITCNVRTSVVAR